MSYIGGKPSKELASPTSQYFNGDGSTVAFTLDRPVNVAEDLDVFVSNVRQEPGSGKSYTATGTTLTFDAAPPSGTGNVYVVYRGLAEVTTRLEHDANAALAATTGTFSGALTATDGLTVNTAVDTSGITINTPYATSSEQYASIRWNNTSFAGGDSEIRNVVNSSASIGSSLEFHTEQTGTGTLTERLKLHNNGDISFYDDTGTTQGFFWDASTENLGIGTTSPVYRGHFTDASAATRVQIENTNNAAGGAGVYFTTYSSGTLVSNATLATDNGGNFKIFTGTSSGAERMRIDSSGRIVINDTAGGTSALGAPLLHIDADSTYNGMVVENHREGYVGLGCHADNNTGTRYSVYMLNGSGAYVGAVSYTSTSTSYSTASDYRLKENSVDMTGAIERVKQLQPKRFNFIADANTTVDGFMAHEAATVVPEAVTGTHNEVDDDGNAVYQSIDQAKLVPLLTGALQEAIAKIEALEARIEALENA